MTGVDRCLICGEAIPEGAQVCKSCMEQYHIEIASEITLGMRDIAGVLSITATTDRSVKRSMESILRIADRLKCKK